MNAGPVLAALATERAWAIDRRRWDAMLAVLGAGWTPEQIQAAFARRGGERVTRPGFAVIPIVGVISHRPSVWSLFFGGTSTLEVGAMLDDALADEDRSVIVLDIDSPGGVVDGVTELAAKIRAARARKRIIAVADTMAASAAYWLASQASEVVVTPSGEVGSIGVFTGHDDISALQERLGIVTTLVASSPEKIELSPYGPLSKDARADLQRTVDAVYRTFVEDVAVGRGIPPRIVRGASFGRGRMVLAADAVAAGMADRIASLEQVIDEQRQATIDRHVAEHRAIAKVDRRLAADAEMLASVQRRATMRGRFSSGSGSGAASVRARPLHDRT